MLCPKCYGRVNKNTLRCDFCGMRMNELNGATNKDAKLALKGIYKDDVMMTSKLPEDINKKKLLLLAIFFGLFGVHNLFVGRKVRGYFQIVSLLLLALCYILQIAFLGTVGDVAWIIPFQISQGISIIMWFGDIFMIAINKFKVPVYKIEFSKK